MDKLNDLISSGASERALQDYLKSNLHLLGEGHSMPKGEYIVISELPIDEGKCDFVVFTSRSRMHVIFIEVKGAEFSFLNKDGSFAAKVNEAVDQVERRLAFVDRNYESFRRKVHHIRQSVIDNTSPYNSILCEKGYLGVDPNKDISCSGIVIAGHTVNDDLESKAKWNKEKYVGTNIIYQSWDSWLRKFSHA